MLTRWIDALLRWLVAPEPTRVCGINGCPRPHGHPPPHALMDETHRHKSRALVDALDRAPGSRALRPVIVLPAGATPCDVATQQTNGRYYCTRAAGHEPPCAAVAEQREVKRRARVECPVCGRDVAVTAEGLTFYHRTKPGSRDFTHHTVRLSDGVEVSGAKLVEADAASATARLEAGRADGAE